MYRAKRTALIKMSEPCISKILFVRFKNSLCLILKRPFRRFRILTFCCRNPLFDDTMLPIQTFSLRAIPVSYDRYPTDTGYLSLILCYIVSYAKLPILQLKKENLLIINMGTLLMSLTSDEQRGS